MIPGKVYAAVATMAGSIDNDGLYGTTDDGETWGVVGLQGRQVNTVKAVKENGVTTLYAGVGDPSNGVTREEVS